MWVSPYTHSYGRWWLNKQGVRLYRGQERIYGNVPALPQKFVESRWKEDMKVYPTINVGNFKKSEHIEQIKDYGILKEFGYKVLSEGDKKRFGRIRKIYYLVPRDRLSGRVLTNFPKDHYVEIGRASCRERV